MPAQLAHIALVNSICTPEVLATFPNLAPSIRTALGPKYLPFCRLGAVSPDCPAVVGSTDATGWNDIMHYLRPADLVRYGIPKVLEMSFAETTTRSCIAWLFGYTAHLVTDLTVHPIVMARVGPYSNKKNRSAHRRCEFDQDAYIFSKLYHREIVDTDFLDFTGLAVCGVKGSTHRLNPAVADLWTYCLRQYPRSETKKYVSLPNQSLQPDIWFATYVNLMDHFATKDSAIVRSLGFGYRRSQDVDPTYIRNLPIPNSTQTINYDDLFEKTRQNLIQAWRQLAAALANESADLFTLANADLDTGQDTAGKFIYWS